MNNLSLTKSELDTLFRAFAGLAILIFAGICYRNFDVLQRDGITAGWRFASSALLVTGLIMTSFVTWGWRIPCVARLMKRPVVRGVWAGTLTSDYVANGHEPVKITIVFVIRQTYLTLSVQSFTPNQEGESKLEAIIHNEKTDSKRVSYLFELSRPYTPNSGRVCGAGELKLLNDEKELKGMYWTDSPTHGTISLTHYGKDVKGVASYNDALRKFPNIANIQPATPGRRTAATV